MAHEQIPATPDVGDAPTVIQPPIGLVRRATPATPLITDRGVARAFVRMLADAVERGDYAEAYRVARGAEVHLGFLAAEAVAR